MGLTGLKPGCRQGCVPSGGSRGGSVSQPFPASGGAPFLGSWPLTVSQSQQFSIFQSPSGSLPLSAVLWALVTVLGPPGHSRLILF